MPIHLPPISRRDFFKRSFLAGAGLAFAPQMFAASRRTDKNSWVLFSDTHISGDPEKISRDVNMTAHFKSASAQVLALPSRPAGLFVCGDCAHTAGEPGDYAQFTKLLDPLRAGGLPVHLALGNHDDRGNFRAALKEARETKQPVADKQVSLVRASEANWFVMDSLGKETGGFGLLGAEQLTWLAKTLDANKKKPAIILVHHNVQKKENTNSLTDTDALLEVIRPRKQVKAWIFGHTHKWRSEVDASGLHLVNLPPVAYNFREGDPMGWVHATLRRDGMKLELRSLDAAHKEHGQVLDLKWREA